MKRCDLKVGCTLEELRKAFLVHLTVYIPVNALLIGVNLIYTPKFLWFLFPLLGWGIRVLLCYISGVYLPSKPAGSDE